MARKPCGCRKLSCLTGKSSTQILYRINRLRKKWIILSFRAKRGISPGFKSKRMRDSSARSVPRNDKNLSFSAACQTVRRDIRGGIQFFPCRNKTLHDCGKSIQNTNLTRDTESTLATMVDDAYVNHVPVMTGAQG